MRTENESGDIQRGVAGAADDGGQREGWQNYVELRRMLRALGDEVRLNIVHVLATAASGDGAPEVNVTDLVQRLGVSQPLISWHLGALRRTGLVRTQRIGREVYCTLDLTRYRLCLRMLGKVLEQGAQSEAPETSAASEAGGAVGVPGLLPRRKARLRPSAAPAKPAPETPESW